MHGGAIQTYPAEAPTATTRSIGGVACGKGRSGGTVTSSVTTEALGGGLRPPGGRVGDEIIQEQGPSVKTLFLAIINFLEVPPNARPESVDVPLLSF